MTSVFIIPPYAFGLASVLPYPFVTVIIELYIVAEGNPDRTPLT
jgi:hypothetical protein